MNSHPITKTRYIVYSIFCSLLVIIAFSFGYLFYFQLLPKPKIETPNISVQKTNTLGLIQSSDGNWHDTYLISTNSKQSVTWKIFKLLDNKVLLSTHFDTIWYIDLNFETCPTLYSIELSYQSKVIKKTIRVGDLSKEPSETKPICPS